MVPKCYVIFSYSKNGTTRPGVEIQTKDYVFLIKKTWSIMKEAIGKIKQVNNNLPRRLIINNKEIYAKKTIAESFNNYFIKGSVTP